MNSFFNINFMVKIAALNFDSVFLENLEIFLKRAGVSKIYRFQSDNIEQINLNVFNLFFIDEENFKNSTAKKFSDYNGLLAVVKNDLIQNEVLYNGYKSFVIFISTFLSDKKIKNLLKTHEIISKITSYKEKCIEIDYHSFNECDEILFLVDCGGRIINYNLKAALEFKIKNKNIKDFNFFCFFRFDNDVKSLCEILENSKVGNDIEFFHLNNLTNIYAIQEIVKFGNLFLLYIEKKEKDLKLKQNNFNSQKKLSGNFEQPLIIISDIYGNVQECNEAFVNFFGIDKKELRSLNVYENSFFDSNAKKKILNIFNKLQKGEIYVSDYVQIEIQSETLYFELSAYPYNSEDVIYYILIFKSIEISQKLKYELFFNKSKFNIASENFPICSFIYQDNKIQFANDYFLKFSEYSYDELHKLNLSDLFDFETVEKIRNAINSNEPFNSNFQATLKSRSDLQKFILLGINKIELYKKNALLISFVDIGDKIKTEEELFDSERKDSIIFDSCGFYVFEHIIDENKTKFFNNWNNIFDGKESKSLDDFLSLIDKNDALKVKEKIARLIKGETNEIALEFGLDAKDGKKYFKLKAIRIDSSYGSFQKKSIWGICSDITEEKSFRERENSLNYQFKMVWDASLDAMRLIDEHGFIVEVNDSFCKTFEIAKNDIIGKPFTCCYYSAEEYKLEAFKKNLLENKILDIKECKIKLLNGKEKIFNITNSIFSLPFGEKRILSVFRDLTQFREFENKIKDQELKLANYFKFSHDGILLIDKNGKILDSNQSALNILKYDKEKIIGANILDLVSLNRKNDNKLIEYYFKLKNNGKINLELDLRLTNLHTFVAELDVCTTNDGDYLAIVRDITEKKKNEKKVESYLNELKRTAADLEIKNIELQKVNSQLKESEEKLKQLIETQNKFFSIVAHDLKNPFNALLGYVDALSDSFDDMSKEEIRTFVDGIKSSSRNIYLLLENLLSWSRIQLGKFNVNIELTNLREISEKIIGLLRSGAEYKNIKLINEIRKDIQLYTDKNIVFSTLQNLTNNAIKFTKAGGFVKISAQIEKNFAIVSVKDNGMGMSQTLLNNLFDLKKSVSTLGTRNEAGTGLGLSLCKEMLQKIGGDIWAESELGKGSTFYFKVPLIQNPL